MLGEAPGRTRADPVIPRPTSSIRSARGNTPGVALMRPVMLVSAPSPRRPVKQLLARPGPMSAGPAATALLGAASCPGMAPSPAATATSTRHHAAWISQTRLGPTNASTATWMRGHLLRDGQQVSSLPCWCSSLGSSWQMPTPAPAQDATTWRLTDATARSPKHSAWLGKVIGLTRADPVMPPPTSSTTARSSISQMWWWAWPCPVRLHPLLQLPKRLLDIA
mmetsp:Transcript_21315/g.50714  ORF Transcript_21315/g.50714 Transcript_21315/m.50714 type:complete len:222 (-) Transcript_21315:495-1160(-)